MENIVHFFSFSSLPEETEKKSDNYYVDGTVLTDLSKTFEYTLHGQLLKNTES